MRIDHYLLDLRQQARLAGADPRKILAGHPPEQQVEPGAGVYLDASGGRGLDGTASIS